MGREKTRAATTVISVRLLTALDKRLEVWCDEYGWSKTKTIEYALSGFLNQREMEVKERGLAETKQ